MRRSRVLLVGGACGNFQRARVRFFVFSWLPMHFLSRASRIVTVWHSNTTTCKRRQTIPIGIQIRCEPMVMSDEERNALEGSNWIAFPLVKVLDHSGTCARARWARHTVFARRASPYRLVNTIYVVAPRVWTKETSTRRWTRAQTHGETGRRIPNRHRPFRLPA